MAFLQRIKDFFTPEPRCKHNWKTVESYKVDRYETLSKQGLPSTISVTLIQECEHCGEARSKSFNI